MTLMKSAPYPDVKAVVRALGGRSDVAVLFECTERAVVAWETLNYLPAKHYKVIRDILGAETVPEHLFSFSRPAVYLPQVHSAHQ